MEKDIYTIKLIWKNDKGSWEFTCTSWEFGEFGEYDWFWYKESIQSGKLRTEGKSLEDVIAVRIWRGDDEENCMVYDIHDIKAECLKAK